jgi:succinate-semialdehyde dehydrogenase / glutarate-semialdehyde dehydrogenase
MTINTVNPYTEKLIRSYSEENTEDAVAKVKGIRREQAAWRKNVDARVSYFKHVLKPNLARKEMEIARLMTEEMGKPISQSVAEVRKCGKLVDYAIEHTEEFLQPEPIPTEAAKSYVRFDSLGVVLLVMPWNYPLWQVFRAAIPAMAAGNGVILKHAGIVTGSSLGIEDVMDSPLFRSTVMPGSRALKLMKYVDGVSFTGSTAVGASIAETAGQELKKAVLELGGSDPFIVLKSADLEKTAKNAAYARLQNGGQSCIASKRFIVHESVYNDFHKLMKEEFSSVVIGDPNDEKTFLGPVSSKAQASAVNEQIAALKAIGEVEVLGKSKGNIIAPVIARTGKHYDEEVFGPVAVLKKFKTNEEAVTIANETPFGLGSSIWGDADEAEALVPSVEAGLVFVNKVVASDPRVPFGGVKRSGFGRELSKFGFREFTNVKTTWVEKAP